VFKICQQSLCICGFIVSLFFAALVSANQPNIVLFNVDDLGWSDLGYSGSRFYESPNVDSLAAEGVIFNNAYACAPNCAPSRACLMSGMYSARHGIYTVANADRGKNSDRKLIPVNNMTVLADDIVTLPEQLQMAGYRTGHFGKWHLGPDPKTQGMDVNIAGKTWGSPSGGGYHSPFNFPNLVEKDKGKYLTDRISEEAVKFIHQNSKQPFFLYLAHYAVHTPIQPRKDYESYFKSRSPDRGHSNAGYAAMVKSMDESLGRVLETLKELGLDGNTIVIFTSDNGGHGGVTSNRPLRGSKGMLYEGGIRVPFVVRWPGKIGKARTIDKPIIGVDILPTLLDAAGAKPVANQPVDGVSILPLLTNPDGQLDREYVYWHFPAYLQRYPGLPEPGPFRTTPASAVRDDQWKLIHFYETDTNELYRVAGDLSEEHNIAAQNPEVVERLSTALHRWVKETGGFVPTELNPEYIAN